MSEPDDHFLREIEKLIDKAEKTRAGHFLTATTLGIRGKVLHGSLLIGSSIVAILTFADYKAFLPVFPDLKSPVFTLLVGLLASIVFVLTVLDEFLGWRETARQHEEAGKLLTTLIRNADSIRRNNKITRAEVDLIRERYTLINEQTPTIPDPLFLKSKRNFLMKLQISRQLDKTPFYSVRKIKSDLRKGGN